jgi:hypothetical protein
MNLTNQETEARVKTLIGQREVEFRIAVRNPRTCPAKTYAALCTERRRPTTFA